MEYKIEGAKIMHANDNHNMNKSLFLKYTFTRYYIYRVCIFNEIDHQ